ncbi:MAG: hypothetical protein ACRDRW_19090 [Pseudonocardiaceae bacterium]
MADGATAGASRENRKAISVTCVVHRGPRGFANLVVEKQGEPAGGGRPVGAAPRWGLSSTDWHTHAIDEGGEHPCGAYIARCGHRLRSADTLYDDPPSRICPSCASAG